MVMPIASLLNVPNSILSKVGDLKARGRGFGLFHRVGGRQGSVRVKAFTLLELVISIAISVSVLMAAALIAVSELRSSIKLYVYQSLRSQVARVTFLIEGEVGEASSFSAIEPSDCRVARDAMANTTFLFGLRHSYSQGPSFTTATRNAPPAASTICYFNRRVSAAGTTPEVFDLYRFGPPFDAETGVLSSGIAATATAATTTLISPGTRLLKPDGTTTGVDINHTGCTTCDGRTLSYKISLQHDTAANSANPRLWNLEYAPAETYTARILSFCVSSDTSAGWCSQ